MARLRTLSVCLFCAVLSATAPAVAQDGFKPESVSVKAAIDPGPNVFVNKQEWGGAG